MNSQELNNSTIALNNRAITTTISLPNKDITDVKDMLLEIEGKSPQVFGVLLPEVGLEKGFIGANEEVINKVQALIEDKGDIIIPPKVMLYNNLTMLSLISFIKNVPLVDVKNDKEFSAVLKVIIQNKILTSKELCEKYDFDKSTISRWLNGKSFPHNIIREEIVQGAIIKAQEQVEILAGSFLGASKS